MAKPRECLKSNVEGADRQVLGLFPSINFYSSEVDKQRKKGMKTCLRVLCIAADEGCVNRYMLSMKYKIGGDSISRALKSLKRLKLLRAMPPTPTEKGGKRIDYVLTAKGVIACMSIPRFQQVQKLYSILLRFEDNMVARTLILLNWLSIPGDGTQTSVAMRHIRELTDQGVNLEQKSEDSIYRDLLTIDENRIAQRLDPIAEGIKELSSYLTPESSRIFYEQFLSLITLAKEDPEVFEITMGLVKEFFLFLLGPEFQAWFRTKSSREDMKRIYDKCKGMVLSEIGMEADEVLTPEPLLDFLLADSQSARTKRSNLIRKLRELLASEVTLKVSEIVNSQYKKK